jgi:hypothetical protein
VFRFNTSIDNNNIMSSVLYSSQNALCGNSFTAFEDDKITGYKCNDRQFCVFRSYNLTFAHYLIDSCEV